MTFEKIKLEDWKKLTKEEQDYHTLKFNESERERKLLVLYLTRGIALIFIGVLFFQGYVQLESVRNYNEKLDTYGTMGFCALCGELNFKQCECTYNENYYETFDRKNYSEYLADYNIQACKPKQLYNTKTPLDNISLKDWGIE